MLNEGDCRLIDEFQRDFPMEPEPFRAIAERLGLDEFDVLASLIRLGETGVISRLGAVLRPNCAGASTLAAMAAPAHKLEAIAEIVNAEPGVNHNYEREHAVNLWFVVTGANRAAIAASLARIESRVGLDVLDLPLLRSFPHRSRISDLRQREAREKQSREAPARRSPRLTICDC